MSTMRSTTLRGLQEYPQRCLAASSSSLSKKAAEYGVKMAV